MRIIKLLLVCQFVLCLAVANVSAASMEVVRWFDGFESHPCDDYLLSYTNHQVLPDIPGIASPSSNYNVGGNDDLYTTINCSKAATGTKSVQQAWNGVDYAYKGSVITAFPNFANYSPRILIRPGCTTVMEMDAYFNYDPTNPKNNGEGYAALMWHGSTLPIAGWYVFVDGGPGSMVRYMTGTGYSFANSDMPMLTGNRWYHFRTEVYEDFTYSVFITSPGSSPQTMISNAPCPNPKSNPPYYNNDYLELRLTMTKGIIYWDNVKVSYIVNNAQGYPDIYAVPAEVVIDGHLGTSEWTSAKKIADKPLGSEGVFKSLSVAQNVLLDPNQSVDVYGAYDSSNFYIAARFNKVTIDPVTYHGSYFDAVFTYEQAGISYVYAASAKAATDTTGLLTKFVGKTNPAEYTSWDPCTPGLNYSDFTAAGGQIAYSISNGVMDVEMKIPFASMPEFVGIVAGGKVNLQFNVTGNVSGAVLPQTKIPYTTSIGLESYPWLLTNGDIGTPFGAGVAFPICGDSDNPYPMGDIDHNCKVNFADMGKMAANWLINNAPN